MYSINIIILIISVYILLLNYKFLSVTHAKTGENLPAEKFEIYSAMHVSILYILIILILISLLTAKVKKFSRFRSYIISLVPLIGIILIILLIFNPHSIILNPSGWPPTRLENFEIGGTISIILLSFFIIVSTFQLYLEGYAKIYLIKLGIIIGALLLSDLIHESGHAIMALLSGGEIEDFYPFPVLLGGEFNVGYVGFSNVPTLLVPLVLLGGEIFQWIIICLILILLYFKPKLRDNLFMITVLFIGLLDFPLYVLNNSIGLPHWFLIGGVKGDIIMFSILTNIPLWIFILLAICQLIIWGVIFYFLKVKQKMVITVTTSKFESPDNERA